MNMIELGGSIELVGFKDIDSSALIILKKIIGNYARNFSDNVKGYEKLSITMKEVGASKFEIQTQLIVNSKSINSDVTEHNMFVAVAEALKKLENQIMK